MKKAYSGCFSLAVLTSLIFIAAEAGNPLLSQAQAQATAPAKAAKQNAVDVNSADAKTLETLPGIGPSLASRIIAGRPYRNATDLEKVKGLGPSKVEALKDRITFGPATTGAGETTSQKQVTKEKSAQSSQASGSKTPSASASAAGTAGSKTTSTAPPPTGRVASKLAPGEKININKANAEELDRLPGIGPAKAQAILDYRQQSGDFKTIEDIQKVKGIKAGEFSKIKEYIKVAD